MTGAPKQLHQWKEHFDKWADERIAQVLMQEKSLAAKKAFSSFLIELEDSDALDHLVNGGKVVSETSEAKVNDVMLVYEKES